MREGKRKIEIKRVVRIEQIQHQNNHWVIKNKKERGKIKIVNRRKWLEKNEVERRKKI
jgi:tRNA(Ile2) C34 agmatinyltransferase TiaS